MPFDEEEKRMLLEHDRSIRELQQSMIVLQRDQANLKEYVSELKDDIKQDMAQMKSELQGDFQTLRADVLGALKSAKDSVPKWAGIIITALGTLIGIVGTVFTIIGVLHGW
jgi:predicted  nucleic acid-binding Zn-ribbon protein